MSILRKKGQRALTHHQQKGHRRDLAVRRAKRGARAYEDSLRYGSRTDMEKNLRGITGRLTPAMRDAQEMRGYR
jgi:hypothetical protein